MNWKENTLQRWAAALLLGFALTVFGGYAYKYVIESMSELTYTIHWFETVPLITLFIAYLVQREWRKSTEPSGSEEE